MRQKTARKLHRLVLQTSATGRFDKTRYRTLKRGYTLTPSIHRKSLVDSLQKAADLMDRQTASESA